MQDPEELGPVVTADPALHAWTVDSADFPVGGTTADVLRFVIRYAVLAPSSHNTQPWQFGIDTGCLSLYLDTSRVLPVSDPDDRELMISCGAALYNLRLALNHFGFGSHVDVLPARKDPALLARLHLAGSVESTHENEELFAAIAHRHTSRAAFDDIPVPADAASQLVADVEAEGAWLALITDPAMKALLAELVAHGDRRQLGDRGFRRELASWLRTNSSARMDGIRGYASGLNEVMSIAEPLLVRTFDTGHGRAAHDTDIATGSPLLAVLGTENDDAPAWLRAGHAMQRVLLRCQTKNLSYGYLNQPIEVEVLRPEVARVTGRFGYPQLVLRIGYGPPALPEPRRELADVMRPDSE